MELSYEEVERYLCEIFSGQKIVNVENTRILFKQPDNSIKLEANFIYDESYNRAIKEGILPLKDLEELIIKRKLFTEDDQRKVNSLKSKLEAQKVLLAKTTKVRARSDRIKEVINRLETELREVEYKRLSNLAMSAETKAEEERSGFICWACTYVFNTRELCWKAYRDFLNETNLLFRGSVLAAFLKFYNGVSTAEIRYMARSSLWRIRYVSSQKTGEKLFGIPVSEYTNNQLNLAYWSNFYDNIYQMMPEDQPSDLIIEDDEALDSFMSEYYKERNRDNAARKKKTHGKLSAFDQEEVIVTQFDELYEDIEFSEPKEAKVIKDRVDIKKRTRRRG